MNWLLLSLAFWVAFSSYYLWHLGQHVGELQNCALDTERFKRWVMRAARISVEKDTDVAEVLCRLVDEYQKDRTS